MDIRIYRTKARATSVTDSLGNTYTQAGKRKNRFVAYAPIGGPNVVCVTLPKADPKTKIVILETKRAPKI